jgi:hypothetical protein
MSIEIGIVIALAALASGAFWRVWALIAEARSVGEQAQKDLALFRERAAETFATKAGMQEQTNALLRAIEGIASRIDGLGERIDNIILRQPRPRS